MMRRRLADRVLVVFGAVIVAFAIVLKFLQPQVADWLVIALVALGAGMVNPLFIVDFVRSWRGTNGSRPTRPEKPDADE
jgi:hypothetical protein